MRGLVECVGIAFPLRVSAPPSWKTQSDKPRVRAEPGTPKAQKHSMQQRRMYCTTTAVTVLNSSSRDAHSGAKYSTGKDQGSTADSQFIADPLELLVQFKQEFADLEAAFDRDQRLPHRRTISASYRSVSVERMIIYSFRLFLFRTKTSI